MKKLISIAVAFILAISLGTTAFAENVEQKYYNAGGELQTDTIDTTVNTPITLTASEYDTAIAPAEMGGRAFVKVEITQPCVVYAWMTILNNDQRAGLFTAVDYFSLDYEMLLGKEDDDYHDYSTAAIGQGEGNGDYEYLKYTITSDMITAAGGTFTLHWSIRAKEYPNVAIDNLEQTLASTGIVAYAIAGAGDNDNSVTALPASPAAEVKGKYQTGAKPVTYSIDIVWGGMEFDYNANEVWDPVNHTWKPGTTTTWSASPANSNVIQVTNHSSEAVNAAFSFAPETAGVTGGDFTCADFTTGTTLPLPKPAQGSTGATTYRVSFVPKGAIDASFSSYAKIGTITISLTAAATG